MNAGESIRGQAVLRLTDSFRSAGGLDKATLTFTGIEKLKQCAQKSDQPKKAKNRNLLNISKILHRGQIYIHDFQGHKTLNGGTYNLPFSVHVPGELPASFCISPVEMSMLEVSYLVSVSISEFPSTEKRKKGEPTNLGGELITAAAPIQIRRQLQVQPVFGMSHQAQFKNTGFSKMFGKHEFHVDVTMGTNYVAPTQTNDFYIKIDNTKVDKAVVAIRMSLTRTVKACGNVVEDESVSFETHSGGPAYQVIEFPLKLKTPAEVVERHYFNTDDGSTKYGSVLAPTYGGENIAISYRYELRLYHHSPFGSDSLSIMYIPVIVTS